MSFKKGSWATVAKIENDTLWNDYIETGKVMGFSIDAMVHLEEINLNKETKMSEQKNVMLQYAKDAIDSIKKEPGLSTEKKVELSEEIKEEVVEENIEVKTTDEVVEEVKAITVDDLKAFADSLGIEFGKIVKEVLKPIEEKNVELNKQVETLKTEVVELGKQPATLPITGAPKQVDYPNMSKREQMDYNRNK